MKKFILLAVLILFVAIPSVFATEDSICYYNTGLEKCVGSCGSGLCVEVYEGVCSCEPIAEAPLVSPIGLFSLAGLLSIAALVFISRR